MSRIYILLLCGLILGCKTKQHLVSHEGNYLRVSSDQNEDQVLKNLISPYSETLAIQMEVELGTLEEELVKSKPSSNLGSWFTDILHEESNKMFYDTIDFALQNFGGLRISSIPKGPVTVGKIYELMPFDNMLVVLNLPSQAVQTLFDGIAQSGGWPISKSISFEISEERKAVNVLIHGQPLQKDRIYRVAIPDYVANGGDQTEILKTYEQENSGVFIRDVVIEHLKDRKEAGLPILVNSNSARISHKK